MTIEFENKPLEWGVEGVEPSDEKKALGFADGEAPAAGHWDHKFHRDFLVQKELQEKVLELSEQGIDTSTLVTKEEFTSHKTDTVKHITAEERTAWNGKVGPTGNVATATKLQTPRKINGTNFDGSSDIVFGRLEPIAITVNDTDMNTFKTPGMYYCAGSATAVTLLNCPTALAFSLLVEKHAGIKQTITEYVNDGTARTFTRNLYQTAWGPWTQILLTKDMTAHETDIAPHQYGNKFEWRYNATTNSLDLVVL